MLVAGEDPLFIVRRVVRMAIEDVGLADPEAIHQALAAKETMISSAAPRANWRSGGCRLCRHRAEIERALFRLQGRHRARETDWLADAAQDHSQRADETDKTQEYGAGYRYDHDQPDAFSGQNVFPDGMGRERYYDPVERGFEREVKRRLEDGSKLRKERQG